MTLPIQEANAVAQAREFLFDLLDPRKTPRVPKAVRVRAAQALKHYPYPVVIVERYEEAGLIDEAEGKRIWERPEEE